ncbi:PAAR domain-containing protein, partial [Pseudomonas aeruginosa]
MSGKPAARVTDPTTCPVPGCGFHAIRPPSPLSSGQAFHGHLATCSTAIRPGSRS